LLIVRIQMQSRRRSNYLVVFFWLWLMPIHKRFDIPPPPTLALHHTLPLSVAPLGEAPVAWQRREIFSDCTG
jgi:hypothetical protein